MNTWIVAGFGVFVLSWVVVGVRAVFRVVDDEDLRWRMICKLEGDLHKTLAARAKERSMPLVEYAGASGISTTRDFQAAALFCGLCELLGAGWFAPFRLRSFARWRCGRTHT